MFEALLTMQQNVSAIPKSIAIEPKIFNQESLSYSSQII